jgi:uncharacterized protein (DUF486 family)
MITALLLLLSNVFMTLAWYGHLKFKEQPLWLVIVASWGLAFFEYLFQVPANRIGSDRFTLAQLKVMQECITIVVFTIIVGLLFRQMPRWNNIISFLLIVAAFYFTFNFESETLEPAGNQSLYPERGSGHQLLGGTAKSCGRAMAVGAGGN